MDARLKKAVIRAGNDIVLFGLGKRNGFGCCSGSESFFLCWFIKLLSKTRGCDIMFILQEW